MYVWFILKTLKNFSLHLFEYVKDTDMEANSETLLLFHYSD